MTAIFRSALTFAAGSLLGLAGANPAAMAQQLATQLIATGLTRPIFVASPPGDPNRLFVVEQRSGSTGRIKVIDLNTNVVSGTLYLSITGLAIDSEQGLLGLAFHPNFMQNGYFFVNYTRSPQANVSAGSTIVARYRALAGNPLATTADPAGTILLTIPQPETNHNGGWMAFGPDGNLFIATGDGGNGNDTNGGSTVVAVGHVAGGNAQSTARLLGKMLRIDVDGPDNIPGNADDADTMLALPYRIPTGNPYNGTTGAREIWAIGVRNPWRNAFDRQTGDLWIADVGQDVREEINVVPGTTSGINYGWRCMEGTRCTNLSGCTCNAPALTLPLYTYDHANGRCSVTGGYVYRGAAMPSLSGTYFFGDYCTGEVWSFKRGSGGAVTQFTDRTDQLDPPGTPVLGNPVSFGEDNAGEMYICDAASGKVLKIVQAPCFADFNQDGGIDGGDVEAFFIAWSAGAASADVNGDGGVTGADVETFFISWERGACV